MQMGEISKVKTRDEIPACDKWTIDEMFPAPEDFDDLLAESMDKAEGFTELHYNK